MKKTLTLIAMVLSMAMTLLAQPAQLTARFSQVQYHPENGGWYFLSEQKNGETLYGLADKNGNVIASGARKYKLHKGYIELYMLDMQKKLAHEQWQRDMKAYEADMVTYKSTEARYKAEKEAYDRKVTAAKQEAQNRWNAERQRAYKNAYARAEYEAKQRQAQNSGGGLLGAIVGGLVEGVGIAAAANAAADAVAYEPFYDRVIAERNLIVGPSKPYNPMPTKPTEPPSGFYWENHALRQPNNYTFIDFEKIKDGDGYADVKGVDGRWGLVDAAMTEIVPCNNSSKVLCEWVNDKQCKVKTNTGYGILNSKGRWDVPAKYNVLTKAGTKGFIATLDGKTGVLTPQGKVGIPFEFTSIKFDRGSLLCKKNNLWGVYTQSFEEVYPCQFQEIKLETYNNTAFLLNKVKGQWGAISFFTGKTVLPNQYGAIAKMVNDDKTESFKVTKNGKYGLIDTKGAIILPAAFDNIEMKFNQYAVKAGNYKGLYNNMGHEIIPIGKYTDYKLECYDLNNHRFKILCLYEVRNGDKVGICNSLGKELIAPDKYTDLVWNPDLQSFSAKVAPYDYRVITVYGEEVISCPIFGPFTYSQNSGYIVFNNGKCAASLAGEWFITLKKSDYKNINKISKRYQKLNQKNKGAWDKAADEKKELIAASIENFGNAQGKELRRRDKFSYFAQNYVERIINDWQQRGEFEKLEDYRLRVNDKTRSQKIYELTREAQNAYVAQKSPTYPDEPTIVGVYDAENETYRVKSKYKNSEILIHVPTADAQEFKANFANLKRRPVFFVENDGISLAEYHFMMDNGNVYSYNNEASLTYTVANVEYNFNPVTIDGAAANKNHKGGKQTISTKNFNFGTSDIDVGIPKNSETAKNVYAVIIANENYQREEAVDYAFNDGNTFYQYCTKALGIPESNVHFRSDATLNDMRFEFNWIKQIAEAGGGDSKFIVYYAGHGMPDAATKDAYLLPVDGYSADVSSGYKLSDMYATLGELPSQNVLTFLDACFSGTQRDGHSLSKGDRGVAITPNLKAPKGKLVVFSATTGNQAAHAYDEKRHGMFTYFLLKKIKEHDGRLNFGQLADYVKKEVSLAALREKSLAQTPTVTPGPGLSSEWKNITIK